MINKWVGTTVCGMVLIGCGGGTIDNGPTTPATTATLQTTPSITEEAQTQTLLETVTEVATHTLSLEPGTPTETLRPTTTGIPSTPTYLLLTPTATSAPDEDGDGESDALDCAPQDPTIFSGQVELCDGIDNNCNFQVDEGFDSDIDGLADCFDEEECDGLDNDGDSLADEQLSDIDNDLLCDELDEDQDGDHVNNDEDPAPEDSTINSYPTAYFHMPGDGWLYLYAPQQAQVFVELDQGNGYEEIVGSPFIVPTDSATRANLFDGTVRITSSEPVLAFYTDALETGDGDQSTIALAEDGSPGGTKLYTWAANTVDVVAGAGTPGTVRVESSVGTGWGVISSVNLSAGAGHSFNVPGANIYRVRTTSGPVSAYGNMIDPSASALVYLSDSTSFVGDSFRFIHSSSASPIFIAVQTLSDGNEVSIRRSGVPVNASSLAESGDVAYFSVTDGAVYDVSSTGDMMAWTEADPELATADTGMKGAAFVPGTSGQLMDTTFVFRATTSDGDVLKSDVTVLSYDEDTFVKVRSKSGEFWSVVSEQWTSSGTRLDVLEDVSAGALIEVTSSRPVQVSHSHGPDEFANGLAVTRQFISQVRTLGESCDVAEILDHCAAGLACSDNNECVDPLAEPEDTPTQVPMLSPSPKGSGTITPLEGTPTQTVSATEAPTP